MTQPNQYEDKPTPAQKALAILKKNLNVWDLKELVGLLEAEIDKESQRLMMEDI